MRAPLLVAVVAEAVTGLALLVVPSLVGQMLFAEALTGVAIPVARVAGVALIALALATWRSSMLAGMLAYNAIVALYFAYLGLAGEYVGVLLWPAVAFHAVLAILLGRAFFAAEARSE